jgi:phosphoenolpyruvate-protein kinase (PTS system EI component)
MVLAEHAEKSRRGLQHPDLLADLVTLAARQRSNGCEATAAAFDGAFQYLDRIDFESLDDRFDDLHQVQRGLDRFHPV